MTAAGDVIGKTVTVIVDRPMGSVHPQHKMLSYPINYGYVPNIIAADGEEQDAYILGVSAPIVRFDGEVIAVIHRKNDVEDKWVVASPQSHFTREEIWDAVKFQEQYFDAEVLTA